MDGRALVGRESEFRALAEVVRTVRRGGRLAIVEGEAGIGKTRLLDAVSGLARDTGAIVLASRSEELDAYRPFAAIVDCAAEAGPRWRERVDAHLRTWEIGPDAGAERQFRVAETVLELLDELSARSPVVLVVDDLQWSDAATLGVLARVATSIDRMPVALLVSARPQPRRPELERLLGVLASRDATSVRLGPLDERASLALLEDLVAATPGERLAAQAARAAGNPLFVCELAAALEADGALVRRGGTAEIAVTEDLPSLPVTILHRLSFLPADVLELLGLASVLGTAFSARDLALLSGNTVAALVGPLRSAQRAGVLAERGDRLEFRHELVRDALYEDMPPSVRRDLHRELATRLAADGRPPERVAEHVLRGASPGDELAVTELLQAARALLGRHPAGAVDLYRRAIELSADPDARRVELEVELAEALVSAGLLAEGERTCRAALARQLEPEPAVRLRLQLVMLLTRRGRTAEAARVGLAGMATPGAGERERLLLTAWVAMSHAFEGELDSAVQDARAVLAASPGETARGLAINTLAMAAAADGRFAEAAELLAPSARRAERIGSRAAHDARPHMLLGLMLARLDRLQEASATIQRGRRAAEAVGIADALPVYHYQAAFVAFAAGRLDDALAELAAHAQLAEQTAIGWRLAAESVRALIALHRDELIAAERHVAEAERDAASGAPPFETGLLALARALVAEAAGDARPALGALADAFAASATFQPVIGPELARLAAGAGAPELAAAVPDALERIARLNPDVASLDAGALRARGLLDGDAGALVAAAERLRGSGRVLERARAAEDAAAALGGAGARELLAQAREAYEGCGAIRDLARVDAAERACGVRRGVAGSRRRPRTGWDALTETELRVVRLVAERLTNPEIAARMFISRRTVQTHVSHALAKLGVDSRRALAGEAARHAGWRIRVEGGGEEAQQPQPAGEAPGGTALDDDRA